jgi:hypothetical protein
MPYIKKSFIKDITAAALMPLKIVNKITRRDTAMAISGFSPDS